MTIRHLGHQVGGRGRDHDEIGVARKPDVADIELARRIEQIRERALARDRAHRHRRDELLRGLGHHDAHRDAALAQPADQVERLVGRDPAGDDEQDAACRGFWVGRLRGCLCGSGAALCPGNRRIGGTFRQQQADLLFHRAAVGGGAQPQPLLDVFAQVSDRQRAHELALSFQQRTRRRRSPESIITPMRESRGMDSGPRFASPNDNNR